MVAEAMEVPKGEAAAEVSLAAVIPVVVMVAVALEVVEMVQAVWDWVAVASRAEAKAVVTMAVAGTAVSEVEAWAVKVVDAPVEENVVGVDLVVVCMAVGQVVHVDTVAMVEGKAAVVMAVAEAARKEAVVREAGDSEAVATGLGTQVEKA